ncbi:thymidine phosphorylase [Paremcibacter congregatus]|uniref:thymidine phosphorylase n=1 Tax=Paremcibacter congregatus TaxID=2043170 RepID=UPI0030EF54A2
MLVKEIIRKKRDGGELSAQEINSLIEGLADGSVSREQVSAFTMAVYFQSMSIAEVSALTKAMISSGVKLDWSTEDLGGPVVDKHSTGGVGDKVSLMLAPMIAACGGYVPMISGRGLGHTGGTLDKMEAIPGYDATPDLDILRRVVKKTGCAIIGQTAELAPADRLIYSVRDVTATVESVALITASILSKKISAGLDALVMDIKVGPGAFMETEAQAEELASSIIRTAGENQVPTHAILTSMDEVLGRTAGNALEVVETLDYLSGRVRDPRLHEVVMALTSEMLLLTKLAATREEAEAKLEAVLDNGQALEIFAEMVTELGGPADFVEKHDLYLAKARVIKPVYARDAGYVSAIDVRGVGNLIVKLGGGRSVPGQVLDMAVGLGDIARIGEYVDAQTPMAMVYAQSDAEAEQIITDMQDCYQLSEQPQAAPPVIRKLMTA